MPTRHPIPRNPLTCRKGGPDTGRLRPCVG